MNAEENKDVWVTEEPPQMPVQNPAVKPLWEALR
ncbi:hypothetical protein SEA_WENTWORTH_77 [Streptomyces phage Wentworth]|jgi:hypothetical protein|nr:hypothetical protein SEA_WENTWORTH_77 [Streptomyces phage Wentworth]